MLDLQFFYNLLTQVNMWLESLKKNLVADMTVGVPLLFNKLQFSLHFATKKQLWFLHNFNMFPFDPYTKEQKSSGWWEKLNDWEGNF
jgi:hypothetical protein